MAITELKFAYDFIRKGLQAIQEIRETVKEGDPVHVEIDKLNDFICGMKDAIDKVKDSYFSLSYEKMVLQDRLIKTKDKFIQTQEKLKHLNEWKKIESKYQMVCFGEGIFLYGSDDPIKHHICPNCFEKKEKSILQHEAITEGYKTFRCPNCNEGFQVPTSNDPINFSRT